MSALLFCSAAAGALLTVWVMGAGIIEHVQWRRYGRAFSFLVIAVYALDRCLTLMLKHPQ